MHDYTGARTSIQTDTAGPGVDMDLARMLAGRTDRIRLYSGQNRYEQEAPWPSVEPDRAWAVHLRDSAGGWAMLALDFDVVKGNAQSESEEARTLLDAHGIRYIPVQSGPRGGIHLDLPFAPSLPDLVVRSVSDSLCKRFKSLDPKPLTDNRCAAIRPPGALHRTGGRSRLLISPEEARAIATNPNPRNSILSLLSGIGAKTWMFEPLLTDTPSDDVLATVLSPEMYALVRNATKTCYDRTDSGVLFSAMLALINAGFAF